jgi:hypothetical protein
MQVFGRKSLVAVRFHLYTWWNLAYLNQTFCMGAPFQQDKKKE